MAQTYRIGCVANTRDVELGVFLQTLPNVVHDICFMLRGDETAVVRLRVDDIVSRHLSVHIHRLNFWARQITHRHVRGVSTLHGVHASVQLVQKRLQDRLLHENPRAIGTDLSGVEQSK